MYIIIFMTDVAADLHKNNLQLLFVESSGNFLLPQHRHFDSGIYSSRRKPKKKHLHCDKPDKQTEI